MKIAWLMDKSCAWTDRITRSPVSGSLRERMITSTKGPFVGPRLFSAGNRLMAGKAIPGWSGLSRCAPGIRGRPPRRPY